MRVCMSVIQKKTSPYLQPQPGLWDWEKMFAPISALQKSHLLSPKGGLRRRCAWGGGALPCWTAGTIASDLRDQYNSIWHRRRYTRDGFPTSGMYEQHVWRLEGRCTLRNDEVNKWSKMAWNLLRTIMPHSHETLLWEVDQQPHQQRNGMWLGGDLSWGH